MNKYRVVVLMSTYNGEKFLKEQIESILNQKDVSVDLIVRDDGSTDGTLNILSSYSSRINTIIGNNCGVGNSFMNLLYSVSSNYDFYAFSDQDDIWLNDKLITAICKLKLSKTPSLYCSNQTIIDAMGNCLGERYKECPGISYKQILTINKVSGCTFVWNNKLQRLLSEKSRRPSKELLYNRIHDVWVAMVASVVGTIIYDNNSHILYRQHENNVVGIKKTSNLKEWLLKLKKPRLRNGRSILSREIIEKYSDVIVNKEIIYSLNIIGSYRTNINFKKYLLNDNCLRKYSGESKFAFQIKVFLNLL